MEVKIYHLIKGAKRARGLTVIIDVFRAFSVVCYLFNNGAQAVIPVGKASKAYELKKEEPDYIMIGERDGKKLPGSDYGNSPAEIEKVDFTGKTVIHTTSAGTQGLVNASDADEIITGSFVNAGAVADYIKMKSPDRVSLVAMGKSGKVKTEEDIYCAQHLQKLIHDETPISLNLIREKLESGSGKKFFDEKKAWFRKKDFELCLQVNKFNFVIRAFPWREDLLILRKE